MNLFLITVVYRCTSNCLFKIIHVPNYFFFQQSLNNVGHPILDPYKKSIEENFKSIKTTLSQESESGKKQLYPEQREWSV